MSSMHRTDTWRNTGFPSSSAGKESTCSAGDPGLIPGLGRSPGEGIGYPLQYSWASLVAQTVKNLPSMQETWIQSLGWEDPLEEGMATHSSILVWKIQRSLEGYGPQACKELVTTEWLSTQHSIGEILGEILPLPRDTQHNSPQMYAHES